MGNGRGKPNIKGNIAGAAFLAAVFIMALINIFTPDREFSGSEKRMLAQFPEFSVQSLFADDEKWTLKFEDYVTDQFPMRDAFVGLKAASERALLKHETGGVYFAGSHALIERPRRAAFDTARINIASINAFCADFHVPVTLALIPNSVYVDSSLLPAFAYDGEQGEIIDEVYSMSAADTVDIASALTGSGLFYRTDHHPTAAGAYRIYCELGEKLGYAPVPEEGYESTELSQSFRGTAAAASGAWWIKSDTISAYVRAGREYTLTTGEGDSAVTANTLFDTQKLHTDDEYAVFLGGNNPVQCIRGGEGEKLLLIKDSFSHCIAPLMAEHFSELHLIDMRYYRGGIKEYIAAHGIDRVLIMYSVDNFTKEKNLVFLNNG